MNVRERGYEPSWEHTYETFGARQRARLLEARRNQEAIDGSVNSPACLECPAEPIQLDEFEQAMGG